MHRQDVRRERNRHWYRVQIAERRYVSEADKVFLDILRDERRACDSRSDCEVYYEPTGNGGHCYYFSPGAAARYAVFVNFWKGSVCAKPINPRLTLVG